MSRKLLCVGLVLALGLVLAAPAFPLTVTPEGVPVTDLVTIVNVYSAYNNFYTKWQRLGQNGSPPVDFTVIPPGKSLVVTDVIWQIAGYTGFTTAFINLAVYPNPVSSWFNQVPINPNGDGLYSGKLPTGVVFGPGTKIWVNTKQHNFALPPTGRHYINLFGYLIQ